MTVACFVPENAKLTAEILKQGFARLAQNRSIQVQIFILEKSLRSPVGEDPVRSFSPVATSDVTSARTTLSASYKMATLFPVKF